MTKLYSSVKALGSIFDWTYLAKCTFVHEKQVMGYFLWQNWTETEFLCQMVRVML